MTEELKTIDARELAVAGEPTPMEMISQALASGATPETLERLMAMQERWQATKAKEAFVSAMTAFKRNPPDVFKNAEVSFGNGKTAYKHATLDNVCNVLNKALADHGLSFRWETENLEHGIVRVTCVLTHEMGHSERVMLQAAGDNSGSKNSIQAVGSTVTYLQRYTLLAATGIAVQGQDDDGAAQAKDSIISEEQAETLKHRLMNELDADAREKFFNWLRVGGVAEVRQSDYARAIAALDKKAGK